MPVSSWWRLARGEHALMTFVAVVLSGYLVSGDFGALWFAALGPALITAGSFILNDWFDYESDRTNRRFDRPLVKGEVKGGSALLASALLFAAGVGLTYFVNQACFFLSIVYAIFSILYSPVLKKIPLAGNAFIASTMGISFLYGNLAVFPVVHPLVALWIAIAFLAGLAREFLITLRDVKGDKKTGALTVPMLIGPKATALASSLFMAFAAALTLLPLSLAANIPYAIAAAVADALLLFAAFKVLKAYWTKAGPGGEKGLAVLRQARELTLKGLIAGLVAFAALALA